MSNTMKKIGVLTSGGDAPGMNAAIRAVTRAAISKNIKVIGIMHGYLGLLTKEMKPLKELDVSGILFEGGSILGSARCDEFREESGVNKGAQVCRDLGIDGLVVIGGDGSFRGAGDLSAVGIPCIGIPATIDNDISCSEYSIGFDTAVSTVTDMAERLRHTSQSHDRCNLIEVMGQRSGDLALHAGIASGATMILIPEVSWSLNMVVDKMKKTRAAGKHNFLIVVSEAVTATKIKDALTLHDMAVEVEKMSGVVTRATELGYVQRGGKPSTKDRITASQMGKHAVDLLEQGIGNRVAVVQKSVVVDLDIAKALKMKRVFQISLYDVSTAISI